MKDLAKKIMLYFIAGAMTPSLNSCSQYSGEKESSGKYIIELTDSTFEKEVYESKIPVMVDFWAPWCYPCLIASPTIEKLAKEYKGKIKVGKLNLDENEKTAVDEDIEKIPILKFYKNSEKIDEIIGLTKNYEDSLRYKIEKVLDEKY